MDELLELNETPKRLPLIDIYMNRLKRYSPTKISDSIIDIKDPVATIRIGWHHTVILSDGRTYEKRNIEQVIRCLIGIRVGNRNKITRL